MICTSISTGRRLVASLCILSFCAAHAYEGFDPNNDPTQVTVASARVVTAAKVTPRTEARAALRVEEALEATHASVKHQLHRVHVATVHRNTGGAH
jgi:hypothetical protein